LRHNISGAPVADETGRLVGMLTAKDCFRAVLHAHYHQEPGETVARFMTRAVQTLEADLDIITAAEAFLASNYRRFPVMQEGRLVGNITRNDLLRAFQTEAGD
jgi:Predicted transcriptional regulator, contains C-terminal CBS domains